MIHAARICIVMTLVWAWGSLPTCGQTYQQLRFKKIEQAFAYGQYRDDSGSGNSWNRKADSNLDPIRFRTYDGTWNNLNWIAWGQTGSKLLRKSSSAYSDRRSEPARGDELSPRAISNLVFEQSDSIDNSLSLSSMVWQWGQFIDHDLDLTESHVPLEPLPIPVPTGDPFFDPAGTGTQVIPFFRSAYLRRTGFLNPRQQVNQITAWIDGSNVYGSDEETAQSLREYRNGRLLCSRGTGGQFLPRDDDGFFRAGDVRVNEQVCLIAMHTLFMREHNRIAGNLAAEFPRLDDEQIFQLARERVVGHLQAITYNEFLPAVLGDVMLEPYNGYDDTVYPGISNVFSGAAYRFGHSMLPNELLRLRNDGTPIRAGNLLLADAFFNPRLLMGIGIDPYLKGLVEQPAQEIDAKVVGSIRNFLFGPPGAGGFDLAALNIQRGRDHGLPDYNTVRERFGLARVVDFSEITSNPGVQQALATAYETVDDIDPWVGILAEDKATGAATGMTAAAIFKDQFQRLRTGDRFWYQVNLSPAMVAEIESTTLADIIRRDTEVDSISDDVFFVSE